MIARLSADFLIIGSGIAGLRAAIELARQGRVLVLTKADPRAGSTGFAQGGIAAAVAADDSVALHAADTMRAGDGLCDEQAVDVLVVGWARLRSRAHRVGRGLRPPRGRFAGSCARRRALRAPRASRARRDGSRDWTCPRRAARRASTRRASATTPSSFKRLSRTAPSLASDSLTRTADSARPRATATLLATGGAGQIYRETTNPAVASGDGVALAYLAGARVADLEFVQFHPDRAGRARRAAVPVVRSAAGRRCPPGQRAGRTIHVPLRGRGRSGRPRSRRRARWCANPSGRAAPVYLSMAHLPAATVVDRFPAIAGLCRQVGLDLAP